MRDAKTVEPTSDSSHSFEMERLALEMRDLRRDFNDTLKRLEPTLLQLTRDVGEIKGKVSNLPTAFQFLGMILATVVTVMIGTFGIVRFVLPHGP